MGTTVQIQPTNRALRAWQPDQLERLLSAIDDDGNGDEICDTCSRYLSAHDADSPACSPSRRRWKVEWVRRYRPTQDVLELLSEARAYARWSAAFASTYPYAKARAFAKSGAFVLFDARAKRIAAEIRCRASEARMLALAQACVDQTNALRAAMGRAA